MSTCDTPDLFAALPPGGQGALSDEGLGPGAVILRGRALRIAPTLLSDVQMLARQAPPRHMVTPGGLAMSVALSNCGALGWVSDRHGYRYVPTDPLSGLAWPAMPPAWRAFAVEAASEAGYPDFVPDACLINRYEPGAKLSLHQDHDEQDFSQPIVSVSLGLPAVFLWGGARRSDRTRRVPLAHGDVVVWGGASRRTYHGVLALKDGEHPATGRLRINLTFRRAG